MVKKFLSILILVVALVGSVSAQSLDDLRKKTYDLSIEAVNKGKNRKSAYEEYLEKQELEAAKKAEKEALEAKKTVDISKFSKLSQLKNIDMQQIESSEDPMAEIQRQLTREYTQLTNKVDFMKDDGNTYRKYLHFAPAIKEDIYCYIVRYEDNTFYLVMEHKDEEVFFQSQILNTEIWFNENGDPLFSDAPGVAIKIHTKLGTIVILDDVDSSYDYFVIWFED